jgi:hypothetical protein
MRFYENMVDHGRPTPKWPLVQGCQAAKPLDLGYPTFPNTKNVTSFVLEGDKTQDALQLLHQLTGHRVDPSLGQWFFIP